ncbi:MAG TPA: hypothetical protein PLL72_04295 [Burkholderiaceae bacterium]|nr:hypothetical protein [Burkholderiaceae bacterium]
MSTPVDICNLALARLGDEANVQSISPPDGSTQAALCAQFYPIARDTVLAMRQWTFATVRAPLALLVGDAYHSPWAYAYAVPNQCLSLLKVLEADASHDVEVSGATTPQPFRVESLEDGQVAVLSNTPGAVAVYIMRVEDAGRFPPLFVDALSWLLASYLAGPIVKGDAGRAASRATTEAFQQVLGTASMRDGAQQYVPVSVSASWIQARG